MKKFRITISAIMFLLCMLCFQTRTCKAVAEVSVSTYDDLVKYLRSSTSYTIVLKKNIEFTGTIPVFGSKTIVGGNYRFIRSKSLTKSRMLDVQTDAILLVKNVMISGNDVSADVGLVRVCKGGRLDFDKDTRLWDVTSKRVGAGIENYGIFSFAGRIHHCVSEENGGAIYNYDGGMFTSKGGEFRYNQAKNGGAIYSVNTESVIVEDTYFEENDCKQYGEAIYAPLVIVKGTTKIDADNDVYVSKVFGLNLENYTGSTKVPIYMCTDKVGEGIGTGAKEKVSMIAWSHNFKNANNHLIVPYSGRIYIGRYITLTFKQDPGAVNSVLSKQIKWGEQVGDLGVTSRTGYTFNGWYYLSGQARYEVTSSTVVREDSNLVIYTDWKPITVALEFDANGGVPYDGTCNVTYDQKISGLPGAHRDGYDFVGWFDSPTGKIQYKDGDISKFVKKTKLYAHWTPSKVLVTLDAIGGNVSPTNMTLYYEQKFGRLPVPTKIGYTFLGWSMEKDKAVLVSSDSVVKNKQAFTLYAVWKPTEYVVSFNANGGTVAQAKKEVCFDSTYGTLPVPVKIGYSFAGWYLDKTYHNKVTESSRMVTAKNHTLYAKWNVNTYKLVFDLNGAEGEYAEKEVVYDAKVGTLPAPTRTGYVFDGWYTSKSGGTKYTSSTKMTEAKTVTLYARWKEDYVIGLKVSGILPVYNVKDSINTKKMKVTATYYSGKLKNITSGYQLQYNNKKSGKVEIIVKYQGKQYKTSSYFYDYGSLKSSICTSFNISMYRNGKSTIGIKNLPYLRQNVSFESSNRNVVSVDKSGRITAKKVGTATIKVGFTINGKKTSFSIKVKVNQPEISIQWKRTKKGLQFTAKTKGCGKVTWRVSNTKIGTIGKNNGKFIGKKKGKTYVYATANGVTKRLKVIVKNGMYECY